MEAKATFKQPKMNGLERRYALKLETDPAVKYWKFEPLNLRIGHNCFYKPDFLVVDQTDELQIHETKGFWRDDARVKMRACAELFPFQFIGVTFEKGVWKYEYF